MTQPANLLDASSLSLNHWEQFFHQGAFLRLPQGRVQIWGGSWKSVSQGYSFGWQNFFEPHFETFQSDWTSSLELSEIKQSLFQFLEKPHQPHLRYLDFETPVKDTFNAAFQAIQGKIQRGEIEKAVPVITARASKTPRAHDRARMMLQALEAPTNLWPYGIWNNQEGLLGATPELLFEISADRLKTMALAGTCPLSQIETRLPLLKDPKEMLEHRLVVDDLVNQLSGFGLVQKSHTEVVELPYLQHLRTRIEVIGNHFDEKAIIKKLHPTPALGVSPRNYGTAWLRELVGQNIRKRFGAPVLFKLSPEHSVCLVAIRNLEWTDESSYVTSGCGIVSSSVFEQEWEELTEKRDFVFKTLNLWE